MLRLFVTVAIVLGVLLTVARAVVPPSPPDRGCALPRNAAWISVEWSAEPSRPESLRKLVTDAATHGLHYLYPYVTYLRADGTFNPTYDYAEEFVVSYKALDPDTTLLAWIGLPLANDRGLGVDGWIDLSDDNERSKIVRFVVDLVRDTGFDGVHIDAETVHDDNQSFLLLLDEIRRELDQDSMLSVASGYWLPPVVNRNPLARGYKWSSEYYREVASRVDQIATMTYDSRMPHPALYRLWLYGQARAIDKALRGTETELLLGISPSQERSLTHIPYAENMRSGLAGACSYVARANNHGISGIALYAHWEVGDADWSIWDEALNRY